ncbi:hypothetical protein ACIRYZ_36505 [Kitasatospora sp. NPDC101155]|uniref:hypothetical protein n=1 Tax=Kitasatospora sp. NPDC101155 TaxID=3364097 RepID=UPI0038210DCE
MSMAPETTERKQAAGRQASLRLWRWPLVLSLIPLLTLSFVFAATATRSNASAAVEPDSLGPDIARGLKSFNKVSLGGGFVETLYSADSSNQPQTLAVRVDAAAMNSLPTTPVQDGQTCFDKTGAGIDLATDCASGHERDLWFPKLSGLPFQWLMFNWQAHGHGPAHVFDKPHFDMHFFIQDFTERNRIRTGPCNLVINCDDEATAQKPVPAPYAPEGWGMPGAAGRMGNHIIDPNAAPANGGPFTQAFAYGTWDGHISFWEPVINRDWVVSAKPSECRAVPQTPAVELTGFYPTQMCTRYGTNGDLTFTLENFVKRTAPAGAQPPAWAGGATQANGSATHSH